MANRQYRVETPMRPNIRITHELNGRVKDYAAESDQSLTEAYREIIEAGLAAVQETQTTEPDVEPHGPPMQEPAETLDPIEEIVDEAGSEWTDDSEERRTARMESLRAALEAVRDEPLSKSELQETVYGKFDVPNQSARTWFRKTVRPYLADVAAYDNTDHKWHWSAE